MTKAELDRIKNMLDALPYTASAYQDLLNEAPMLVAALVREVEAYHALARGMDMEPKAIALAVQEHAPWNGYTVCESAMQERLAMATLLRNMGLSLVARAVEKGEHLNLTSALIGGDS